MLWPEIYAIAANALVYIATFGARIQRETFDVVHEVMRITRKRVYLGSADPKRMSTLQVQSQHLSLGAPLF